MRSSTSSAGYSRLAQASPWRLTRAAGSANEEIALVAAAAARTGAFALAALADEAALAQHEPGKVYFL